MKVGIIIQARMASTRLPGKTLRKIGQKSLLEHILFRLSFLKHPAVVVVATSVSSQDYVIADFCREHGVQCFRGSETNVLARYYHCAQGYGFDHVVRLTGDNPFTDIEELDRLIELHIVSGSDFSQSLGSLPVGVGAEIFTFAALEKSFGEANAPHHFEHVDEFLLENLSRFKTSALEVRGAKNRPAVRLTVDTEEDYRKACFIFEHAPGPYVATEEAIRLCSRYV